MKNSCEEAKRWAADPELVQRARTLLVVSLSKRPAGELIRIIMEWLDDEDLYLFCQRNLDASDVRWIQR
jgi:hypothetical protein